MIPSSLEQLVLEQPDHETRQDVIQFIYRNSEFEMPNYYMIAKADYVELLERYYGGIMPRAA